MTPPKLSVIPMVLGGVLHAPPLGLTWKGFLESLYIGQVGGSFPQLEAPKHKGQHACKYALGCSLPSSDMDHNHAVVISFNMRS